ncbi:MAG: hypothetical protein LBU06_03300 [Desulfovibrio sp.]|nr:hypothetical protein [Desulfovibrio sp.]
MSFVHTHYHQRGKKSMPQFTLPFKYEEETKTSGLTGLAGLPLYLELLYKLNIFKVMRNILDPH